MISTLCFSRENPRLHGKDLSFLFPLSHTDKVLDVSKLIIPQSHIDKEIDVLRRPTIN